MEPGWNQPVPVIASTTASAAAPRDSCSVTFRLAITSNLAEMRLPIRIMQFACQSILTACDGVRRQLRGLVSIGTAALTARADRARGGGGRARGRAREGIFVPW